ncbi:MAG: DUF2293 domain-containing protein, partial [Bryobacteraceae bacterium]
MGAGQLLCLACARLNDLEYLPSGDAALTRRAGKYSGHSALVVRFSRSRGRATLPAGPRIDCAYDGADRDLVSRQRRLPSRNTLPHGAAAAAAVRHTRTRYDALLAADLERGLARERISGQSRKFWRRGESRVPQAPAFRVQRSRARSRKDGSARALLPATI